MADNRERESVQFWLDKRNPEQRELLKEIRRLKRARAWARTVRTGIRIMIELQHGDTTTLYTTFPWLGRGQSVDLSAVYAEIGALRAEIRRVDPNSKAIGYRLPDAPQEPAITVTKAQDSGASGRNFLNSLAALQDD